MSEPPGLPSAFGIEAVQWLAQGESVNVRVQGRWRRRRPTAGGQALLVIEAQGGRHRFPAMPEPPSITGAAPGTWQMSFSVPVALEPHLADRAWLQLGAVAVPLPLPLAHPEPEHRSPEHRGPEAAASAEWRVRGEEFELETARRRADEAETLVRELRRWADELEQALERARAEPERLKQLLSKRERSLRVAEQRAYAERARRHELEEQLATEVRERVTGREEQLGTYAHRIRELEDELGRLTRRADEAEHAARAALAARPPAQEKIGPILASLRSELDGLRAALEREITARALAERKVAALERDLRERGARAVRTSDAIQQLREELLVRDAPITPPPPPAPAPEPEREPSYTQVDPERFAAALSRLRDQTPRHAPEPEPQEQTEAGPEPKVSRWLAGPFRKLAGIDPDSAGRILLGLLPAQGLAHPDPLTYELVLGEDHSVRVSVTPGGKSEVERDATPSDGLPQLVGSLGSVARLIAAGPLRRRLRLGLARTNGGNEALTALTELINARVTLDALIDAGIELSPLLALKLIGASVGRTRESLVIAYQDPRSGSPGPYLRARDLVPPSATTARPPAPVTATIVCPPEALLAVLAGRRREDVEIRGRQGDVETLISWVARVQRA